MAGSGIEGLNHAPKQIAKAGRGQLDLILLWCRCAPAMPRARLCREQMKRREPLAKITFPVEAGHIMLFARAIGDYNPVYHDAEVAKNSEVGGIIAPPTFPQAVAQFDPDYPLRWRPGQPWFGSGKTPSGVEDRPSGGGGLHAEQHFEYHRQLRPGDVLTVETRPGNTWERESRRAGKLTFRERISEYRNQHGELVVTARSVGVTTERPVERS
jgi:acyl dehydratase